MKKFIVILAGGEGKRLQSITGDNCPKQFFRATPYAQNMLEITFERLHNLHMKQESTIFTATKDKYKELLETCVFKGSNKILIENESCQNTAAAMFNIIYSLSSTHGESVFAFFPVDHKIDDAHYFNILLSKVMRLAENMNNLFLLGSKSSAISSHLGYIVPNLEQPIAENNPIFPVTEFVEKPSAEMIESLSSKNPLVNMGIFVGKASLFLEGFLGAGLAKRANNLETKGVSFDKEIIPHLLDKLVVVEYESTWQDLGVSTTQDDDLFSTTESIADTAFDSRLI